MIALTCILSYLIMVGFIGAKSDEYWIKKCRYKSDALAMRNTSAALWPIFLPIFIGMLVANTGGGMSRVDKRRAREIEEAKHQTALAKIRYEEDRLLNKQLGIK